MTTGALRVLNYSLTMCFNWPRKKSEPIMSWKTLRSKVVFDNPWMTVLEDRVVNPSGGQNDYGHVRFKNRAVAIIPIDDANNTWLVGQDRYTLAEYSWELPMGGAPKNEDPLQAAKRELREETGIRAAQWTELMRLHTSNSITELRRNSAMARRSSRKRRN